MGTTPDKTKVKRRKYDPSWPFPQYDEKGKQLKPPRERKPKPHELIEDAPF